MWDATRGSAQSNITRLLPLTLLVLASLTSASPILYPNAGEGTIAQSYDSSTSETSTSTASSSSTGTISFSAGDNVDNAGNIQLGPKVTFGTTEPAVIPPSNTPIPTEPVETPATASIQTPPIVGGLPPVVESNSLDQSTSAGSHLSTEAPLVSAEPAREPPTVGSGSLGTAPKYPLTDPLKPDNCTDVSSSSSAHSTSSKSFSQSSSSDSTSSSSFSADGQSETEKDDTIRTGSKVTSPGATGESQLAMSKDHDATATSNSTLSSSTSTSSKSTLSSSNSQESNMAKGGEKGPYANGTHIDLASNRQSTGLSSDGTDSKIAGSGKATNLSLDKPGTSITNGTVTPFSVSGVQNKAAINGAIGSRPDSTKLSLASSSTDLGGNSTSSSWKTKEKLGDKGEEDEEENESSTIRVDINGNWHSTSSSTSNSYSSTSSSSQGSNGKAGGSFSSASSGGKGGSTWSASSGDNGGESKSLSSDGSNSRGSYNSALGGSSSGASISSSISGGNGGGSFSSSSNGSPGKHGQPGGHGQDSHSDGQHEQDSSWSSSTEDDQDHASSVSHGKDDDDDDDDDRDDDDKKEVKSHKGRPYGNFAQWGRTEEEKKKEKENKKKEKHKQKKPKLGKDLMAYLRPILMKALEDWQAQGGEISDAQALEGPTMQTAATSTGTVKTMSVGG
ncbi:hypothetical protein KVT40_002858 [Elsinoe batatas]|uniref:Uncharacterized protein n=1 Tax=Elsinoe batatas TaxID=2601811 RepID=A0A8K0PIZ1_9PEZI|nr:hypothetical protein KVT40_002858 [Elsinoe batatas]